MNISSDSVITYSAIVVSCTSGFYWVKHLYTAQSFGTVGVRNSSSLSVKQHFTRPPSENFPMMMMQKRDYHNTGS